jgi:hypothetical protein
VLAVLEQIVAEAGERASAAYATQGTWMEKVRAGLYALLEFCDERPEQARLCVVEAPSAGPRALARREQLIAQLAGLIDAGRAGARRQPPPYTAEGVVGAVLGVLHSRLLAGEGRPLLELVNPLMSFIALQYRGAGAARMELHRAFPAPLPSDGADRPLGPGPLDRRLTSRSMSVLAALAAEPGLSNRELSVRAGVTDQGQMSRALARLAQLGLIENLTGRANGAPNAWRLTPSGSQTEGEIGRWYRSRLGGPRARPTCNGQDDDEGAGA